MALSLGSFALRNVLRHRRRSLLVMLALAGGLFVLVFLKALQDGFVAQRLESGLGLAVGHVAVTPGSAGAGLSQVAELRELCVAVPGVRAASARVRGRAFARSAGASAGLEFLGVDPEHEAAALQLPGTLVQGSFLARPRLGELRPIVLGLPLATELKLQLGERVALLVEGRDGSLHAEAFALGGLYRSGMPSLDQRSAYIELSAARRLVLAAGEADELVLSLDDPEQVGAVLATLSAQPAFTDLTLQSWHQLAPELRSAMEMLRVVEGVRTVVLFVLVGLGALNAVAMSMFERRREFGVLMAMGMRPGAVLRLLLCEMGLLAAGGVLLGSAAAWLVTELWLARTGIDVSALGANLPGALEGTSVIYPYLDTAQVLGAAAWVVVLSLAVLAWPAYRLLRLDPAAALVDRT